MIVSGLPDPNENHAVEILEMSIDMLNEISSMRNPSTGEPLKIRIGIHTGPVVSVSFIKVINLLINIIVFVY
jgi:class 3 adenylate cyclase